MWNIVPTEYEPRKHLSLQSKKVFMLPVCFGYYVEHGNLYVMYHKLSIPFQSFSTSIVWLQHSINVINPAHIPVVRQNTIRLSDFHIVLVLFPDGCSCGFIHNGELKTFPSCHGMLHLIAHFFEMASSAHLLDMVYCKCLLEPYSSLWCHRHWFPFVKVGIEWYG